jgi:hypothetical protein
MRMNINMDMSMDMNMNTEVTSMDIRTGTAMGITMEYRLRESIPEWPWRWL